MVSGNELNKIFNLSKFKELYITENTESFVKLYKIN